MKLALLMLCAISVAFIGYAGIEAVTLGWSWASVDRVSLDSPSTSAPPRTAPPRTDQSEPEAQLTQTLPQPPLVQKATATTTSAPTTTPQPSSTTTTLPGEELLRDASSRPSVMLLVGSDSRAGLEDASDFGDFPGRRADVIVIAIRERDRISLVSVPRDLYVEDLCRGGRHRIGDALSGCGDTGGFAHLVAELEHLTGLDIEHLAAVDLAGFQDVVDSVGGYEMCTDFPLRDRKSGLRLQAGCTLGDGETTLQWLRSRYTERRVDGSWERVPAVSDLTRNRRQRRFLMDVVERIVGRDSPRAILEVVESVAPHLTLDDQLSLSDAAAWLWGFRSSEMQTAEIPVGYARTDGGASVLVPEVDVQEFVSGLPARVQ